LTFIDWRRVPAQIGIVLTLALIPIWLRIGQPALFAQLYVTRFLIFLPLLLTIFGWLLMGMPGFHALLKAEGRGGQARRAWALLLLLLAAWAAFSTEWAFIRWRAPHIGGTAALQFCVVALFAIVMVCCAPTKRVIAGALAFSLAWNAPLVIAQALNGGSLGLTALGEFAFNADMTGISLLRADGAVFARPYGLLPHPNVAAGALLVGTLASASLVFAARRVMRLIGAALIIAGFAALLLTFSRGAWIGLAVGGLVGLLLMLAQMRRRDIRLPLTVTLMGVIIVTGWWLNAYRPFVLARAGEGQESIELRSVADRIVFTDFALRSIGERPILGVGIGNFPWRSSYYIAETFYALRGDNVHHVYLLAWAELGTPGALMLVGALIAAWISVLKRPRTPERAVFLAVTAAFAAVGWVDHYPWTLLHMQVAWWGMMAAAQGD
jgi:hypothetical protein